ncbi:MAG: DUF692 domain-containing protein [Myxococcota bacterium]
MPSPPAPHSPPPSRFDIPFLGVGVGLRTAHYADVLERGHTREEATGSTEVLSVDWFELLSENYMVDGGRPLRILEEVRALTPVALHGVSMNIGSSDPLDADYLNDLERLIKRVDPSWISDHLCWTGVGGHQLHDLLPLPYTEEAIRHVAARVRQVQDRLGRPLALENVSSYITYKEDTLSEWEFLLAIVEEADCGILLDVNNIYVSAHNHSFDAERYIDSIPPGRVFQIHLAGHSRSDEILIDTHDHPVCDEVWALYERAIARLGPVSTLIEWDDQIPTYARLVEEANKARGIMNRTAPPETAPSTSPGETPHVAS